MSTRDLNWRLSEVTCCLQEKNTDKLVVACALVRDTERFEANYDGGDKNERAFESGQTKIRFHGIRSPAIMSIPLLRDFRGAFMDTIRTTVHNGRIDVQVAADLPDGTEVEIRIVPASADYKPGDGVQDETPEEIEASIERLMSIEPLIFSPDEQAAWDAAQAERKRSEKEHFMEWSDRIADDFK